MVSDKQLLFLIFLYKFFYVPMQTLFWLFMYSTGLVIVRARYLNARTFRRMAFKRYERDYLRRIGC